MIYIIVFPTPSFGTARYHVTAVFFVKDSITISSQEIKIAGQMTSLLGHYKRDNLDATGTIISHIYHTSSDNLFVKKMSSVS